MYIFPDQSKQIGFTIPHSGAVPNGAAVTGFSSEGGELAYGGEKKWAACDVGEGSYGIIWDGANEGKCTPVVLKVNEANC
jgi:hypothetical protein